MKVTFRISGPIHGFYLAAYAAPEGELVTGYAKLTRARPADPWDESHWLSKTSFTANTYQDALEGVENLARMRLIVRHQDRVHHSMLIRHRPERAVSHPARASTYSKRTT